MPNVSVRILVIVLVGGVLIVMHTPAGKDSEKATAPPYDHALGKQSASAEDPPAATGASGDSMVWGAVAVASVCSLMYLTAVVVYFAKGEVDWSGVPYMASCSSPRETAYVCSFTTSAVASPSW